MQSTSNECIQINIRDGKHVLHCTAEQGNLEIVAFLIESGANIDGKDKYLMCLE